MVRATAGRPTASSRPRGPSQPRREGGAAPAAAPAVAGLVSAPLAAAGFDLEEVHVTRAGARHVVAVSVDRDGGLDLDAVAEASRIVSAVLDACDGDLPTALRDAYTLEVSSRGATAALTAPRHWRRASGRLVEVRRRGAGSVTGRLVSADETGADLDVDGSPVRVGYDEVARAVVQLEFRRVAPEPAEDLS